MDSIRSLRTFVRAFELGSLSAVAREQRTTQPTISKVVASLERDLGVRLLERTTTSQTPTAQGQRFYERAKRLLEEYDEAVGDARGQTERPAGLLRVNAPVGLGELRLNAMVLEFLQRYPDIQVELTLNDRFVDLVEDGVDVAIRLGEELPPNVVARHVAVSPRYFVAAPSYLQGKPKLRRIDDLRHFEYVRFAWLASGDMLEVQGPQGKTRIRTAGRYSVNSSMAIRDCLRSAVALGMSPAWLVKDLIDSGELVRVLPRWSASSQMLYLVYPSRRYQPLRARVFMEFVIEKLQSMPGFNSITGLVAPWEERPNSNGR